MLIELLNADRAKHALDPGKIASLVTHVGQFAPHDRAHNAGVKKGDIVTAVNGATALTRGTDIFAKLLQRVPKETDVKLTILRDGTSKQIEYSLAK